MSMDIRWWAANGGVNMGGRHGRNQLPIYPPGYRAQPPAAPEQGRMVRRATPEEIVSVVLSRADGDELDELLSGGLEAGAFDAMQSALGIPKSFAQLNPGAASYVTAKAPTVQSVMTGKAGASIAEQQAKDAADAEQYWRDHPPPKDTGPAMVASAGASPEEIEQVRAYNESKGYAPVQAQEAQTKGFLETIGLGVPKQVFEAVKNDSTPTMVASAGASPEEIEQVRAYNEAQGKGPVTAAVVPSTPDGSSFVSNLLRTLTGGVVQATGGGPAQTALGSLLGLGLGGPAFGSGPLPGNLGAAVQNTFGTPGLPPAYARGVDGRLGMTPYAFDPTWQQYAAIGDYAGTTVARSMLGTTIPELQSIRAMLERQAAQVQATHEAAVIASTREFRREVIRLLHDLVGLVIAHDRRVSGATAESVFAPRRY